ncbi:unnamed protein product [Bemisia tabaci]|uniref:RETREG1-3/ARL6IP-like N-terminal reticulon-homology domain-containing protein n=1 Tax=Bemisia tabaci TaxID=7038 RepID=A0A9P0F6C1_BEMTA|nr:unnamed protein product [Bemisia tabaci]
MASEYSSLEKDKQIKKLKRELESWRVIVVEANSVLLWEKPWYPGAVIGFTSFLFFLFWLIEPSFITTVSMIGFVVTLLDYLVPTVVSRLSSEDSWTGAQERKLEDICTALVETKLQASKIWCQLSHLKHSRPKSYIVGVLLTLSFLAWTGNYINNTFLTYFLTVLVLMYPGLKHHGYIEEYSNFILLKVYDILVTVQGKKPKAKAK